MKKYKNRVFVVDKTEAGSGKHTVHYTTIGNLNRGRAKLFKTSKAAIHFAGKKAREITKRTKRRTVVLLDIGKYHGNQYIFYPQKHKRR